jgi:hypothetical protein
VVSSDVGVVRDARCSLSLQPGPFTLVAGDRSPLEVALANVEPDDDGTIAFPEFGLAGVLSSGAGRNATLVVTCTRDGGSPPPLQLNLTALAARAVTCVPPAGTSTSQATLPVFSVGVALGAVATSEAAARAAACAAPPQPPPVSTWPQLVCRVTDAGVASGSPDVLLQGATVTVDAPLTPYAEFRAFAVSAPPAATYALRLTCSLGEVAVPPVSG